jgi:hypothetical protein
LPVRTTQQITKEIRQKSKEENESWGKKNNENTFTWWNFWKSYF